MNSPQFGLRVASALAGLIGAAHLLRLVTETEVMVGTWRMGLWLSVVAIVPAAAFSYWFARLAARAAKPPPSP